MAHRKCKCLFGLLLSILPLLHVASGCSHTDLSGYKPASQHAASPDTSESLQDKKSDAATGVDQSKTVDPEASTSSSAATVDISVEQPPVSALVPVNVVDGGNVRALMNNVPAATAVEANGPNRSTVGTAGDQTPTAEPKKIEVLIKDKAFRTEPKTGALRVSFDDLDLLKVLNMEPVVENAKDFMPGWLRDLDGKTIRLRGYMYPTFDTEGIEHFVLARDNQICCFGRDPKIYDLVQVDMKPGKTTSYIPATRAFDVVGKFQIQMHSQDGKPYGLYFIEQAEVIDR